MLKFKNNSSRMQKEYQDLATKNESLRALLDDLVDYCSIEFSKDVLVTMIFRTQGQQEALYGKGTKRKSPHMYWNAVDIRHWIYTKDEKKKIIAFLKDNYDGENKLKKLPSGSSTVWLHKIPGNAMHFHIQYKGPLVYVFSQGAVIRARPNAGSAVSATNVTAAQTTPPTAPSSNPAGSGGFFEEVGDAIGQAIDDWF